MSKFSKVIILILYPFIIIYWIVNIRGLEAPHIIFYFTIAWQIIETVILLGEDIKVRNIEKNINLNLEKKKNQLLNYKINSTVNNWWIHLVIQFSLLISYYYLAK